MASSDDAGEGGKRNKSDRSAIAWKTMAFALFGVFILVLTDVIELKQTGFLRFGTKPTSGASNVVSKRKRATTSEDNANRSTERNDRFTYQRRGQPMTDAAHKAMEEQWGSWTLVDNIDRPTNDYYAKYPNRDIPRVDFPANAWQTDNEYLSKFLPEALAMVSRAQEAILAEYGQTEGSWEERSEMFTTETFDTLEGTSRFIITKPEWRKDSTGDRGGWTTTQSMQGLKRGLLHAVMTEDSWILALGGHSAAAGHGNHFEQSAALQVGWILEPVFARLGVRHESKNFANGGLGTIQHGLAAASIYGPAIDMLWWDSGACS
jgi:hypothetical protein